MNDEENELVRQIIQKCAACKHGRSHLTCRQKTSQCHSRKVREWLKQIQKIQNK